MGGTSTGFTDLVGCALPIQVAPMGPIAGPELATAVSGAGAFGMVGGALLPPPVLGGMLDEVARHTDGPVGVNFLVPFLDHEALTVAAAKARVVDFHFGEPDAALVDAVHGGGALAGWQVGTSEEARRAADAGCDLVVAQGVEAGGHVRGTTPLRVLLEAVLAAVDVPVVAAGGMATGEDVAEVLGLGADAVRLGTRFIASPEANAHPDWVRALIESGPESTELTEFFYISWPNAPHRVLRSAIEAAAGHPEGEVGQVEIAGQAMPLERMSMLPPTREATGEIAAMALYAGEGVARVQSVMPAAEIVAELATGLRSVPAASA